MRHHDPADHGEAREQQNDVEMRPAAAGCETIHRSLRFGLCSAARGPALLRRGGLGPPRAVWGFLLFVLLVVVPARGTDRDPARLHRLRNLAYQLDLQQAVLEGGAIYLNVVGQAEGAAARPRRDALIEHLLAFLDSLAAFNGERVLLGSDGHVLRREAGDREADRIPVFAGLLDVVGRVGLFVPAG